MCGRMCWENSLYSEGWEKGPRKEGLSVGSAVGAGVVVVTGMVWALDCVPGGRWVLA